MHYCNSATEQYSESETVQQYHIKQYNTAIIASVVLQHKILKHCNSKAMQHCNVKTLQLKNIKAVQH